MAENRRVPTLDEFLEQRNKEQCSGNAKPTNTNLSQSTTEIQEAKDMSKEVRKTLSELMKDAYNAEDVLDGAYAPDKPEYKEFTKINKLYATVLKNLNDLVEEIEKEIK